MFISNIISNFLLLETFLKKKNSDLLNLSFANFVEKKHPNNTKKKTIKLNQLKNRTNLKKKIKINKNQRLP